MPWYDETPVVLPPMVFLIDQRPARYVALVWDEPNNRVTHLAWKNRTTDPWTVTYDWKNQTGQTYTIPAMTGHTELAIPPGQQKFIPLTGDEGRWGFDSEVATVEG